MSLSYVQRRRFLWTLLLIGLILVAIVARATTLVRLSFSDLVRHAAAIARVHCTGSETRVVNGEILTDTFFQVIETQKGTLAARITVRQPGGRANHLDAHVEESPAFHRGEDVILFLWGDGTRPYSVLGWSQGTFRIRRDLHTGAETVTQDSAQTAIYDPEANAFTKSADRNVQIEVFQEALRRELRRQAQ